MEHLSLQDSSATAGRPAGMGASSNNDPAPPQEQELSMPPPIPRLPPQMFTTAAQLLDLTDKKLMISLRDGRKLIGVLRSWDQFGLWRQLDEHYEGMILGVYMNKANLVLQDTTERIFVSNRYADIDRGVYLVRGENVLLLGEIDLDKDDHIPVPYKQAPFKEVSSLQQRETEARKRKEKIRHAKLAMMGFEGEIVGEGVV